MDLRKVFCIDVERVVHNDWTIHHKRDYYQITKAHRCLPRPQDIVIVSTWLDGSIHLMYKGSELSYELLAYKPERKVLVVAPKKKNTGKPSPDHPWKNKWFYAII